MKLTQIRNATLVIDYAGKKFLIDPMLAEKGAYPAFANTPNSHLRNPLVELPLPLEDIIDVDAVIVTHLHPDHWDEAACRFIAKDRLIFTQNGRDAEAIRCRGFSNVRVMDDSNEYEGVTLIKTGGQHGSDAAYADAATAQRLGSVCGIVFRHPHEKAVYVAGDTVWVQVVADTLTVYRPGVVVVNAGCARIDGIGPIIMGKEDLLRVHRLAPDAVIVATHMEALNHCLISRRELREFARAQGIGGSIRVPEDGETCFL